MTCTGPMAGKTVLVTGGTGGIGMSFDSHRVARNYPAI
jgi:short-subunit dehydrogenase involved in D-alanine esterification of teichoic acids